MKPFISGHVAYDRLASYSGVIRGNVVSDAQLSNCIRGKQMLYCNGAVFPEGHLRDFDLGHFKDLPYNVRQIVMGLTEGETSVILYEVRHWTGETKILHGYVITNPGTKEIPETVSEVIVLRQSEKSRKVVELFAEYLQ